MCAVVEKSNINIKVKIVEKHRGVYLAESESPNYLTFTKERLITQYESWKKNNNVCIDLKSGKNYMWVSKNDISYFINDLIMETE